MAVLLLVLVITIGLSLRAGLLGQRSNAAGSEATEETALVDTCARSFVLVLVSLLGLLALGITYGNVLGGVSASP